MEPDSTQQSTTSGMRRISPLHASQRNTTASTRCLCKSISCTTSDLYTYSKLVAFAFNSATLPTHATFVQFSVVQRQNGNGVAQYLLREIFQSGAVSKMFKNRPCLRCSGNQLIFSFSSIIRSFTFWMLINQAEIAL